MREVWIRQTQKKCEIFQNVVGLIMAFRGIPDKNHWFKYSKISPATLCFYNPFPLSMRSIQNGIIWCHFNNFTIWAILELSKAFWIQPFLKKTFFWKIRHSFRGRIFWKKKLASIFVFEKPSRMVELICATDFKSCLRISFFRRKLWENSFL